MNNKILLTGGAGYIGSHTAVELLQAGYDVVIADNFSNSSPDVIERIQQITEKELICYEIDVTDENALSKVFEEYKINTSIHFAGYKPVGDSVAKPLDYYRNNLNSSITLLEVMLKYNVKHVVFSSSATVYGIPEIVPLTEEMNTFCTNPYGWTKWMTEQIMRDVCTANPDFSVVLLRYFSPIGAHESGKIGEKPCGIPNNLLPYVSGVADGRLEHLNVFGNDYSTPDGTGVRDYIHVVDLAKGHLKAVEYAEKHFGTEVFNLGTGKGYSVLEIVEAFERVNNVKVPYVIAERRPGDIAECYANTDKAEKVLGWKAEKELDDMCRDAWRWQKSGLLK